LEELKLGIVTYIWGSGFNEILMMTEGANTKYMLTDALGSVTAVYDASTATVEFTTYDVYGNSETAPTSPYGYAGMRYAAEFDGYITPNRAYSPRLGRWLQPDPLGTTPNPQTGNVYEPLKQYSDGVNLYCYVGNEPVNHLDDWGLISQQDEIRQKYIWIVKGKPGMCTRFINIDGHGSPDGTIYYGNDDYLYEFHLTDMPDPGKCCCTIDIIFKTCHAGKNKNGILGEVASFYKNKCPNSKVNVRGCKGLFRQFGWSTGPGFCMAGWNKVTR